MNSRWWPWVRRGLIGLLFLSLAFVALRKLLPSPGVLGQEVDWGIPPFGSQYKEYLARSLSSWNEVPGLGQLGGMTTAIHAAIIVAWPLLLGWDGDAISKGAILLFMVLAGISLFYLCRSLGVGQFASLIAGVLYMFTPSVFDRIYAGHLWLLYSYAVIPLALALLIRLAEKGYSLHYLLLSGFLLSEVSNTVPFIISVVTAFGTYLIVYTWKEGDWTRVKKSLLCLLAAFAMVGLLQASWVFPRVYDFVHGGVDQNTFFATYTVMPGTLLESPESYSLQYVLRLGGFHRPAFFNIGMELGGRGWLLLTFLIPILAFSALLVRPRDRRVVSFGLIALISVIMVTAASESFRAFWELAIRRFIFLLLFREPSKWIMLGSLAYMVLISFFVDWGLSRWRGWSAQGVGWRRFWSKAGTAAMAIALVALILSYSWPFMTGNFGGKVHTYDYGQDYRRLLGWLESQEGHFRVLSLPAPSPTKYPGQQSPSPDVMAGFTGRPTLYRGGPYEPPIARFLYKTLYESRTQELSQVLTLLGVKYILFDTQKVFATPDEFTVLRRFPEAVFTNEKLVRTLKEQNHIVPVINFGSIQVYENTRFQSYGFPTSRVALYAGDLTGLVSLAQWDGLDMAQTALVFLDQLSLQQIEEIARRPSSIIILQDGHQIDVALALLSQAYRFNLTNYLGGSPPEKRWGTLGEPWYNWYHQAVLGFPVIASAPRELIVPFTVSEGGQQVIYIKAYFGPQASGLQVSVDGQALGNIVTATAPEAGFLWVKVGGIELEPGRHMVKIQSSGVGGMSSMVIAPFFAIEEASQKAIELMRSQPLVWLWEQPPTQELTPVLALDSAQLSQIAPQSLEREPKGEPYRIERVGEAAVITLPFRHDRNTDEGLHLALPVPRVGLEDKPFFEMEYKVDSPAMQYVVFRFLLDSDGDGQVDEVVRSYDMPVVSLQMKVPLGGVYTRIFFNIYEEIKELLKGNPADYNIIGVELSFMKLGADASGENAGEYSFSIRRLAVLKSNDAMVLLGSQASQGTALATPLAKTPSRLSVATLTPTADLTPVPLQATLTWEGQQLIQIAQKSIERQPGGEPYNIEREGQAAVFALPFRQDQNTAEAMHLALPVSELNLRDSPFFEMEFKVDRTDIQDVVFRLFLDSNGDGKADEVLRSYEMSNIASLLSRKKGGDYLTLRVNVVEAFKGELKLPPEKYNIVGVELSLQKRAVDARGDKGGNFHFHIRRLAFLKLVPIGQEEPSQLKVAWSLPKDSEFQVYVRAASVLDKATVLAKGAGLPREAKMELTKGFQWYKLPPFNGKGGSGELSLAASSKDRFYLDQVVLAEAPAHMESPLPLFTAQRLASDKYDLTASAEGPFYVFLPQPYNTEWKLFLPDGSLATLYPGYSFGTLFYVEKTGKVEMTLEFARRGIVRLGNSVALISNLLVLVMIAISWLRLRRKRTY